MKLKAVLVLMMLVFVSLLSFSNRCGKQCDGRTMVTPVAADVHAAAKVAQASDAEQDMEATEREEAGSSPLLRMSIVL